MAERSLNEIIQEGQELTLEWGELKQKEIRGNLSTEEKARLLQLDGYLLGLMGQAMSLGFNPTVGMGIPLEDENEVNENYW